MEHSIAKALGRLELHLSEASITAIIAAIAVLTRVSTKAGQKNSETIGNMYATFPVWWYCFISVWQVKWFCEIVLHPPLFVTRSMSNDPDIEATLEVRNKNFRMLCDAIYPEDQRTSKFKTLLGSILSNSMRLTALVSYLCYPSMRCKRYNHVGMMLVCRSFSTAVSALRRLVATPWRRFGCCWVWSLSLKLTRSYLLPWITSWRLRYVVVVYVCVHPKWPCTLNNWFEACICFAICSVWATNNAARNANRKNSFEPTSGEGIQSHKFDTFDNWCI